MLVVDSSAIVAMMLGEPSAADLATRLASEPPRESFISAVNYAEAGTVLAGRHREPLQAIEDLDTFLAEFGIQIEGVTPGMAKEATRARIRFGRGFGARASLNFGDCFAYVLAKRLKAPLLYIGDDFRETDIVSAL